MTATGDITAMPASKVRVFVYLFGKTVRALQVAVSIEKRSAWVMAGMAIVRGWGR